MSVEDIPLPTDNNCPKLIYDTYEEKHGYRPIKYEELPDHIFHTYMEQTDISDITLMEHFCAELEIKNGPGLATDSYPKEELQMDMGQKANSEPSKPARGIQSTNLLAAESEGPTQHQETCADHNEVPIDDSVFWMSELERTSCSTNELISEITDEQLRKKPKKVKFADEVSPGISSSKTIPTQESKEEEENKENQDELVIAYCEQVKRPRKHQAEWLIPSIYTTQVIYHEGTDNFEVESCSPPEQEYYQNKENDMINFSEDTANFDQYEKMADLDYFGKVENEIQKEFLPDYSVGFTVLHSKKGSNQQPLENSWYKKAIMNSKQSTVTAEVQGVEIKVLFDTGASRALINSKVLDQHPELAALPRMKIAPRQITVASAEQVTVTECIRLKLHMQGHDVLVTALVMPMTNNLHLVLGMKEFMEGEIDIQCSKGKIEMVNRSIPVRPLQGTYISPGKTREINFGIQEAPLEFVSAEGAILNAEIPTEHGTRINTVKIDIKDRLCTLKLTNNTTKPWKISNKTPIGYLDMRSVGYYDMSEDNIIAYLQKNQPGFQLLTEEQQEQVFQDLIPNIDDEEKPRNTELVDAHLPKSERKVKISGKDPYPWLDPEDPRRFMTDSELIRTSINLDKSQLSNKQKEKFYEILDQHRDAFSLRDEIGLCPNMEVSLELHDKKPFQIRPYPIAENQKEIIDKEMRKGVKLGILKVGQTSYSSPIMLIPRKNSPIPRIVTDFRHLNTRLVKMTASIPLLRDAINTIGASECEVISVIDLRDAYHTLRLHKDSQKYCGITPYHGSQTYLYQRLGMGLAVSPAIWQNFINRVLDGIPTKKHHMAIMDDCLVHSKTKQHITHLIQLFKALIKNGLKISPRKCQFFRKDLVYMGHNITIRGKRPCIQPMKERTDAIQKLNQPTSPKECKRFCGMINFLSMFLKDLQIKLAPIYALTRKGVKFEWTKECQENFEAIKELVCKAPVLYMPTMNGYFHMYSDTSKIGTGASLYQEQEGEQRLVGFNSKKLPEVASRYGISELELFGLTINVCSFKTLLTNRDFAAYVDHSALKDIVRAKRDPTTNRIKRLLEILMDYSFTLAYKKGTEMVICDFLSRHPDNDTSPENEIIPVSFNAVQTRSAARKAGVSISSLYPKQKRVQTEQRQEAQGQTPVHTEQRNLAKGLTRVQKGVYSPHVPPQIQKVVNQVPFQHPDEVPKVQEEQKEHLLPPYSGLIQSYVPKFRQLSLRKPEKTWDEGMINDYPDVEVLEEPPEQEESPILKTIKDNRVFRKHLPQQVEINEMLKNLRKRVIHDYSIPLTHKQFRAEYTNDPVLYAILQYIEKQRCSFTGRAAVQFKSECSNYVSIEGLLFKIVYRGLNEEPTLALCVPQKYVPTILYQYHDMILSGHQGYIRTFNTITKKYYFPRMGQIIRQYILSCHECQSRREKVPDKQVTFLRLPVDYKPMSRMSMDVKEMLPSNQGYKHVLVCTCELTNYVVGIPIPNQKSDTLMEALFFRVICMFGNPKVILTDQATGFNSKQVNALYRCMNMQPFVIMPKHHSSLKTERQIQTLNTMIGKYLTDEGRDWPVYVAPCVYAMNTFESTATGYSPFEMVFLRKPPNLLDYDLDILEESYKLDPSEYMKEMYKRFRKMKVIVLDKLYTDKQKELVKQDRKHPDSKVFTEGDLVFLDLEGAAKQARIPNKKLNKQTWVGPLKITQVIDDQKYMISDWEGKSVPVLVTKEKLKPYHMNIGFMENYKLVTVSKLRDLLTAMAKYAQD